LAVIVACVSASVDAVVREYGCQFSDVAGFATGVAFAVAGVAIILMAF
jgi:hypothetical protein